MCSKEIDLLRRFFVVHIKLIPPKIDLIPAQCRLKIAKSTLLPGCPIVLKGGYTTHLVPHPTSINIESKIKSKAVGKSQKLKLFKRGNLISGEPSIRGNIQFPNPPIILGITIKKIIRRAWAVSTELYICPFPKKNPGLDNSKRIIIDNLVPTKPEIKPKRKYNVPMSL